MPKDGSKILRKQIKDGEKEILRLVKEAKQNVSRKISQAVNKPNFATSASIRAGLYKGIVSEYIRLERKVNKHITTASTKTAKDWVDLAKADLSQTGVKLATFGEFSKKYLDDILEKVNPSTIDKRVLLSPRIGSMAKGDIDAVRAVVTETMRKGAIEGLTTPEMATMMKQGIEKIKPGLAIVDKRGRRMNADSYFAMLNRTVTAQVARETYTDMSVEAGYDLQQVEGGITEGSLQPGDPCSRWAGKILSMTGKTKGYPTYADALADGMFHPNCCVPETEVLSPDLKMVSRFDYSGEMVKIKYASGNTLTVTPNHMLLTDQGFARAHTLAKGDNVIRYSEGQRLGTCSPDIDRRPSMIKDIFMSCRKSLGMLSVQMPMTTKDFHGDGKFGNGDVDVIFSHSLLCDDFGTQTAFEPILENDLVFTDSEPQLFLGDGTLQKLLLCAGHATNRIMGFSGIVGSPLCASSLLGEFELLGLASDIYSVGNKDSSDDGRATAKRLADFIVSNPGLIELDSVVSVDVFSYTGHVYDLQSLSTLYTSNGYLSSNCVHTLRVVTPPRVPEAKEQRKEEAKEGAEGRKKVNKERKEDGLPPAKF